MIELFTLFPDRLNLNGDQANLLVLSKRLEWNGVESRIVALNSLDDLSRANKDFAKQPKGKFLLVGHGSAAAMASFSKHSDEIRQSVCEMARTGMPGLAVGSGYELVQAAFTRGARVSDYADIEASGELPRAFGYINTDTDLQPLAKLGANFLVTLIHGPVLARTPELADLFIERMGEKAGSNRRSLEVDALADAANQS
jgi:CobQ-like glutamine amidotransferase family enzyme